MLAAAGFQLVVPPFAAFRARLPGFHAKDTAGQQQLLARLCACDGQRQAAIHTGESDEDAALVTIEIQTGNLSNQIVMCTPVVLVWCTLLNKPHAGMTTTSLHGTRSLRTADGTFTWREELATRSVLHSGISWYELPQLPVQSAGTINRGESTTVVIRLLGSVYGRTWRVALGLCTDRLGIFLVNFWCNPFLFGHSTHVTSSHLRRQSLEGGVDGT